MENTESTQETKNELIVFDLYWTLLKLPSKSIKSKITKTITWFFNKDEVDKLRKIKKAQLIQEIGMNKKEIEEKSWVNLTQLQFNKLKKHTENVITNTVTYPDVLEILDYLKSKWYKIALISNLSKAYEEPLRKLLDGVFDYEILSYKEWVRKPDYEIFKKMSEISWYEFKDMIMIWDSFKSDVLWAKNAWMIPIFLNLSSKKMELIKYDKEDENSLELIQIHKLSDLKELL